MDSIIPGGSAARKKRIKRRGPQGPVKLVCTSSPNPTDNTVEIGLVVALLVMTLYLYGFFESIRSLPDAPTGLALGSNHFGKNLNLAKDEWTGENEDGPDQVVPPKAPAKSYGNKKMNQNDIVLPETKWPVTVRDEDGAFEAIIHPGDGQTEMTVPPFWSPPIHHGQLMTRETAMKIGSCNEPDPKTGRRDRGDDCPVDERTIYFAIASYRDFQCRYTVESAFNRAKNPERIRVGEFSFCCSFKKEVDKRNWCGSAGRRQTWCRPRLSFQVLLHSRLFSLFVPVFSLSLSLTYTHTHTYTQYHSHYRRRGSDCGWRRSCL